MVMPAGGRRGGARTGSAPLARRGSDPGAAATIRKASGEPPTTDPATNSESAPEAVQHRSRLRNPLARGTRAREGGVRFVYNAPPPGRVLKSRVLPNSVAHGGETRELAAAAGVQFKRETV